jgi:divalent metal cation (Fe/Co/Zn/Cd) transporter
LSRGREAYFWALLAAIGVFVVGAVLAVYEGVRELVNPVPAESFAVAGWPGVVAVRRLVVTFMGPNEVLVVARVDIDDDLDGAAVERLVSGIERELRAREPAIARVDVVPTG